jgi:hypothetical protein
MKDASTRLTEFLAAHEVMVAALREYEAIYDVWNHSQYAATGDRKKGAADNRFLRAQRKENVAWDAYIKARDAIKVGVAA